MDVNVATAQSCWPHSAGGLLSALNVAVERIGLSDGCGFTANLQPHGGEHLVVADIDSGLVARLRPAAEADTAAVARNLRAISQAATQGAPVLCPAWPEPVPTCCADVTWLATLWPLATDRRVTVTEMADVLRGLHDACPPDGLGDWLDICFGTVRRDAEALATVEPSPPAHVVESCVSLAEAMMLRLETLVNDSPSVLVHGDSHPANIVELDGQIVACDLDRLSLGPPEADLVIPLSHSRTYPGADPAAGMNLVTAYDRPINRDLLAAAVDMRGISKTVGLVNHWSEPFARDSLSQRLDAVRSDGKFARLHGTERLCGFAL